MSNTEVVHDAAQSRYEITVDTQPAGFAEYRDAGDNVRDFNHTVVKPEFRGQGLSKPLIQEALDDTRASGKKIIPTCSAVADFIHKNENYQDLVAPK